MARKKVKLVRIQNDSARRATFKKRKKGLIKKIMELSILCDIKACVIIYSQYEPAPEVWPPDCQEAMMILSRFRNMPEMEQSKKMMNQEGFLIHRISKIEEQLKKISRENREGELIELMYQCLGGRSLDDLSFECMIKLGCMLEMKIKVVEERIEKLVHDNTSDVDRFNQHQMNGHVRSEIFKREDHHSHFQLHHYNQYLHQNHHNNGGVGGSGGGNVFMYGQMSPHEGGLQPYFDGGWHFPATTLHPAESNQAWFDNYWKN